MAIGKGSRKPREKKVPANETKRAKFERLGSFRMGKALKAISAVGNLSGPGYEYTETDVALIKRALGQALNDMLTRFAPKEGDGLVMGFSFANAPQTSTT